MTPADASLPIARYVRVSAKGDREDEKFHSPKEQDDRAVALIRSKGLTPGPLFTDIDVSGATPPDKRPAMREMLAAIERGELGGAAAFSLDRFSREPAHGDALVKRITKAGGVLLSPDMPDAIETPTGEFTFGMLLQVAKLYRSQAGARFASAKERSIREGIPVGPTPFGYRLRPDRRIELDPDAAPIVREVFERRARGATLGPLADYLRERTGRSWTIQGVKHLLGGRIHATGRLHYGELVSEWQAEPIVDEPLWQAAQRSGPPRRPRNPDAGWLLTGLIRCATCGRAMHPTTSSRSKVDKEGKPYRRYKCPGRDCEARASVAAPLIERWVVLQSYAAGDALKASSPAPDLRTLEDALAVAERRLEQVMAPEARDALGDLWAADVKARRVERDRVAAELGRARAESGGPVGDTHLREVWDDLSHEDRRSALQLFWREVRVGPKRPEGGRPITLVARGPLAEVEVDLPDRVAS